MAVVVRMKPIYYQQGKIYSPFFKQEVEVVAMEEAVVSLFFLF